MASKVCFLKFNVNFQGRYTLPKYFLYTLYFTVTKSV